MKRLILLTLGLFSMATAFAGNTLYTLDMKVYDQLSSCGGHQLTVMYKPTEGTASRKSNTTLPGDRVWIRGVNANGNVIGTLTVVDPDANNGSGYVIWSGKLRYFTDASYLDEPVLYKINHNYQILATTTQPGNDGTTASFQLTVSCKK